MFRTILSKSAGYTFGTGWRSRPRPTQLTWQLILALCLFGCSGAVVDDPVADDEANKRALSEGKPTKQAAKEYFYPRKIVDYFDGMDVLSTVDSPHPLLDPSLAEKPLPEIAESLRSAAPKNPGLSEKEALGRNTWMIWCGGNEGLWDDLARTDLGFIDLLKLLDSRQRGMRFQNAGMINEPGMRQARTAKEMMFGLWLDVPSDETQLKWRNAYLNQTFEEINGGMHKSQRGLSPFRGVANAYRIDDDVPYLEPGAYVESELSYDKYADSANGKDDDQVETYQDAESSYSKIPPPDIYGVSSGVVGLRLFPNPYFDEEARSRWDGERYYDDESYYRDSKLVRPFRVGMSCAFCHGSWHPLNPPADRTNPEWSNISGNIGAQYLRVRATFANLLKKDNFVYHILDSQPPGTIDTSLIASDNINNPNTMNSVFNLPQRALLSFRNPREQQSAPSARLSAIWAHPEVNPPEGADDAVPESWRETFAKQGLGDELTESNSASRWTPRVLLDGADSIGAWGALARVYLNIGSYWERWNQLHQPVLGFTPQKPFAIEDCEEHSVYWNATSLRVPALRDYFLKASGGMPLLATKDAAQRLKPIDETAVRAKAADRNEDPEVRLAQERAKHVDLSQLPRGRRVFAQHCIVCHSSIQPESSEVTFFGGKPSAASDAVAHREKYGQLAELRNKLRGSWASAGEFWDHDPGQWLRNSDYQEWALDAVERPEFWAWNFLSTDYRVPINLLGTNSGRAMATNAMTGHMWEDFSSNSYRNLPSPGLISYFNPYAGENGEFATFTPRHKTPPGAAPGGGGPGYYRVPTLVSIWTTAPFLHNNSLGLFNNDPTVDGRLLAFDDSIRKLLWPERRLTSSSYNDATPERLARDHGLIWRTTEETYLEIAAKNVPEIAQRLPLVSRLKDYSYLRWLRDVSPLWLPSSVLLFTAWVLMVVSNDARRKRIGWLLLGAAAVFVGLSLLSGVRPMWKVLAWIPTLRPAWFLTITLVAGAVTLLLPFSRKWVRYVSYGSLTLSVLIGGVVYFNAGKLGDLRIGPIPKGTPVNLLANLNSEADVKELKKAIGTTIRGLAEIESRHLEGDEMQKVLKQQIAPALMEVNKCPDFVMDKGHYFEWFDSMTDDDKNALIELLKTF